VEVKQRCKISKDYISLCNRVAANKVSMVNTLLSSTKDIDITAEDGNLLSLAIENGSHEIIELLLNYFFQTQLTHYTPESADYNIQKYRLHSALQSVVENTETFPSPEMLSILKPYTAEIDTSSRGTYLSTESQELTEGVHKSVPTISSESSEHSLLSKNSLKGLETFLQQEDVLSQADGQHNYTTPHMEVHAKEAAIVEMMLKVVPETAGIIDGFDQTSIRWVTGDSNIRCLLHKYEVLYEKTLADQKSEALESPISEITEDCETDEILSFEYPF